MGAVGTIGRLSPRCYLNVSVGQEAISRHKTYGRGVKNPKPSARQKTGTHPRAARALDADGVRRQPTLAQCWDRHPACRAAE
jgi:hypothetical protein